MADSCKRDDSDNIDYRYHQRLSDEDWKPEWRITNNHFVSPESTFFARWGFRICTSPAKVISKKNDNKIKYTLVYAVAILEKSNVKI